MKKIITACIFGLLLIAADSSAQTSLSGRVVASSTHTPIENAVVLIIQQKDSMLVSYTRTATNGNFTITGLRQGSYTVLITSTGFADYTHDLAVSPNAALNLGDVNLLTMAHVLEEVIVKKSIPKMRIKGDTTEYRADSFHVAANATVEDLLKVLPGITVDDKGNIVANGKRIQEVLVDGEPFFSDDPTIVTKNLRANMVDKVQLYEKKTDLEKFTGVAGQKKNVVDFKLKEDKKHGYFGNVSLAGGLNGYHNTEIMFNKFSGNEKFSAFGIVSNTGGSGMSRQNIDRFSDNSIFSNISEMADPLDLWTGNYDGRGSPLLQTGGVHYNNKWNGDNQSVNLNYRVSNLNVEGRNNLEIHQLLNDRSLETHQLQTYHNTSFVNRANGYYQLVVDSTSTIKVNVDGNSSRKKTNQFFESEMRTNGIDIINTQTRSNAFDNDNDTYSGNIIWMKKFRKKRRTFSAAFSVVKGRINSWGYVNAVNTIYTPGSSTPSAIEKVDQFKENRSGETNIAGSVSYTEPISPKATLNLSYGQAFYEGNSMVNSYNRAPDHTYSVIDNTGSNDYSLRAFRQKVNLQYALTKKKYSVVLANEYNNNWYDQQDRKMHTNTRRNFVFNNPLAQVFYSANANSSLSISYIGSTVQPSIQQLQPLSLNLNPLNTFTGNPYLKPSYTHTISFNFLRFALKNNQSMSSNISFSKVQNAISLSSVIDSSGKALNQWINTDGSYIGSGSFNFNTRIPKLNLNTAWNIMAQVNRYASVINGLTSYVNSNNYSSNLNVGKTVDKKYFVSVGGGVNYTTVRSSLRRSFSNEYFSFTANAAIDVYFLKRMQIHLDGNMLKRQAVPGFDDIPATYFVNAWMGGKLLKEQNLLLKASINNVFDSNDLNTRLSGPGYTSQTNYNVIGRYVLFTIAWNFISNNPKK